MGYWRANRVLRGGSWNNNNTDNFRCDYRNRNNPYNRNNNNGFRLSRLSLIMAGYRLSYSGAPKIEVPAIPVQTSGRI